jgi:hypothetical protein
MRKILSIKLLIKLGYNNLYILTKNEIISRYLKYYIYIHIPWYVGTHLNNILITFSM